MRKYHQYLKIALKAVFSDFWPLEGRRTPQEDNRNTALTYFHCMKHVANMLANTDLNIQHGATLSFMWSHVWVI